MGPVQELLGFPFFGIAFRYINELRKKVVVYKRMIRQFIQSIIETPHRWISGQTDI